MSHWGVPARHRGASTPPSPGLTRSVTSVAPTVWGPPAAAMAPALHATHSTIYAESAVAAHCHAADGHAAAQMLPAATVYAESDACSLSPALRAWIELQIDTRVDHSFHRFRDDAVAHVLREVAAAGHSHAAAVAMTQQAQQVEQTARLHLEAELKQSYSATVAVTQQTQQLTQQTQQAQHAEQAARLHLEAELRQLHAAASTAAQQTQHAQQAEQAARLHLEGELQRLARAHMQMLAVVEGLSGEHERQNAAGARAGAEALHSVRQLIGTVNHLHAAVEQDGDAAVHKLKHHEVSLAGVQRSVSEEASRRQAHVEELQRRLEVVGAHQRESASELTTVTAAVAQVRRELRDVVQATHRLEGKFVAIAGDVTEEVRSASAAVAAATRDAVEARLQELRDELGRQQGKLNSELQAEMRLLHKKDQARITELDEQLWVETQRIAHRIDELGKVSMAARTPRSVEALSGELHSLCLGGDGHKLSSIGSNGISPAPPARWATPGRPRATIEGEAPLSGVEQLERLRSERRSAAERSALAVGSAGSPPSEAFGTPASAAPQSGRPWP